MGLKSVSSNYSTSESCSCISNFNYLRDTFFIIVLFLNVICYKVSVNMLVKYYLTIWLRLHKRNKIHTYLLMHIIFQSFDKLNEKQPENTVYFFIHIRWEIYRYLICNHTPIVLFLHKNAEVLQHNKEGNMTFKTWSKNHSYN